jgi:L-cystine uptake protein TcyP (sodium:dicarboxylate symporter family)
MLVVAGFVMALYVALLIVILVHVIRNFREKDHPYIGHA